MKRHVFVLGAALLCAARPAAANGRYPAAGLIAVDPTDPHHLLIRATYGLLTTSDGGAHWSWICEGAVGYSGFDDPMLAITQDGSILAGLFEGLSATHDRGCQWDVATTPGLAKRSVVDVAVERAAPANAVLLASSVLSGDKIVTQVWESKDNGRRWAQAGVDLPDSFLGLTLDSAPSDPQRLYVSGRHNGPTFQGVLMRSANRGATWDELAIPGSDDHHLPYIGAVDPKEPDIVYVRRDGDTADALLVTKNGGADWKEVFTPKSLLGLALSPDGATIAAGSDQDGLWIAPTATLEFTKVSDLKVRCLTWTPQGLFACADELKDGFTAGVSTTEGKTFSPLARASELCGTPAECGPASSTGKVCPTLWPQAAMSIGQMTPCGVEAGGGGGGGGASAGAVRTAGRDGGCSCGVSGEARSGVPLGIALAGASLLSGLRRRRRCGRRS